jgi:hypothetical protein
LRDREASLGKQRRPNVKISVSHPGIEPGINSHDDTDASRMQATDHVSALLVRLARRQAGCRSELLYRWR